MKGFQGGLQQLMKQANQMQSRMKKLQDELDEKEYEATSGGNAVKVKLKGTSTLTTLTIDPEVMKSGDAEMLQDLILTAVNTALKTAKESQAAEMQKVTGGMNIPGMF